MIYARVDGELVRAVKVAGRLTVERYSAGRRAFVPAPELLSRLLMPEQEGNVTDGYETLTPEAFDRAVARL